MSPRSRRGDNRWTVDTVIPPRRPRSYVRAVVWPRDAPEPVVGEIPVELELQLQEDERVHGFSVVTYEDGRFVRVDPTSEAAKLTTLDPEADFDPPS